MSCGAGGELAGTAQPHSIGMGDRVAGGDSHLSIFTATFMVDCEWLRPWAVASTTRPKAPEPRVRPAGGQRGDKVGGDH